MRPVVVTAVLLLVVLMSMSASAAWNPGEMCRTKYPVTPCSRNSLQGWYQVDTYSCVKVFHTKLLNQDEAEDACKKFHQGHLVSIHSLAVLEKVECAMYRAKTARLQYWIGLQRNDGFRWSNGSKLKYTHWAYRQPDNSWWQEHCVEMNYGGWGRWNDVNCRLKRPYVCEVNLFNFWG